MSYTETALFVDSTQYSFVAPWAASHAYAVGNIVRQLAAPTPGNERCFVCYTAGTSGTTEPGWSSGVSRGTSFADGGANWMECTGQPPLNGDTTHANMWLPIVSSPGLGTIIKNTAGTSYFLCATGGGGTGAATEPTWNTTPGATTIDGSVTWTCIGAVSSFSGTWKAPHGRLLAPLNGNSGLNYWLINSGMTIFVGDDHIETNAASATYSAGTTCSVVCVDHAVAMPPGSANLKITASISITGGATQFMTGAATYVYGIALSTASATGVVVGLGALATRYRFDSCGFAITASGSNYVFGDANGTPLELRDCTFSIVNWAGSSGFRFAGTVCRIDNSVFTASVSTTGLALLTGTNSNSTVLLEGCDFSGVPNTQYIFGTQGGNAIGGMFTLKDCVLSAGMLVYAGGTHLPISDPGTIDLNRVDSGGTAYRNERYRFEGQLTTSTSIVRTGGATDGATPVSHQLVTNTNTDNKVRVFNALPLTIWNAAVSSNRNVSVYGIANDSRVPNNDEVWFTAEYLGSVSSPKGSYVRGGKANVLVVASSLAADTTSAWDSQVSARANTTAYTVGQVIKTASNVGRVFFCLGAGTSAAAEPTAIAASANSFNPSDKTASVTLSGGNLTAVGSASVQAVRSTGAQFGNKFYLEYLINVAFGSAPGILNGATAIASFGSSSSGGSFVTSTGTISYNGANTGLSVGAISNGQTVCVAVDLVNKLLWYRVNNGNWNGTAGTNPAIGTGGIDISSVFSGSAVYAAVALSTSSSVTANFGATAFTFTPPSGFVAGPAQLGYATAVDGDAIADGTATFRAGCRFSQTLILGGPATYSTWDPATLALTTLSGGNLVATNTGTTQTEQGAHGTLALTSGKYYFEATRGATSAGVNQGIGIGTPASTYTGMGNVGGVTGDMTFIGTGNIYANGSNTGSSIGSIASGYVVGVAADLDNRLVWFRVTPSGNWNGSSTANPATGVGGIAIPAGAMTPFCTFGGSSGVAGGSWTGNFGSSGFTGAVPSGFSAIGQQTAVTTWNPADCSSFITLSGGNLTASTSTGNVAGGRSTTTQSATAKAYFEYTCTTNPIGLQGIGLATATASLSTGNSLNGVLALPSGTSTVYLNNVSTGINIGSAVTGSVICVAVDYGNNRIWFRVNGGNWNGSGTANPATNTGGIDISSLFMPYAYLTNGGSTWTTVTNFGATSFAQAVPSGFSAWNSLSSISPPVFVNAAALSFATAISVTPALPGSRVNGNLLIAICRVYGSTQATLTTSAGWSIALNAAQAGRYVCVAYCYVTGSETAPTFTASTTDTLEAWCVQYSGTASSSPIGMWTSLGGSNSSPPMTVTGIPTTGANSVVASVMLSTSGTGPIPTPTGFTSRATSAVLGNAIWADQAFPTVGTNTGPLSVTFSGGNYSAALFEILPISGVTLPQPQQPGYLYVNPKLGRASMTYWIDPLIQLS